ncbi:Rv1733c family protein [Streptomyces sp. NPDC002690]
MRAVSGVWRWRHNPLCRMTDRREAWLAFCALLLVVVVAPAVGWLCGLLTDSALRDTIREQQAHRHRTSAVVLGVSTSPAVYAGDPESGAEPANRQTVTARWKAPDGGERRGTVPTAARVRKPGERVLIWVDDRGTVAPRPMDVPTAHIHAGLAGTGAFLVTAGVVGAVRRTVVRCMVRRRYERLDRAWATVGPDWGRTGTGS